MKVLNDRERELFEGLSAALKEWEVATDEPYSKERRANYNGILFAVAKLLSKHEEDVHNIPVDGVYK